jgi:hypothetical protein
MSSTTPPNFEPQGTAPVAKKTSIWVWILGGIAIFFFAIMLTCGIGGYMLYRGAKSVGFDSDLMKSNPGLALAKMATAMNPDFETVKTNDREGTIVVREKSTGKVITLKFDPNTKKMVMIGDDGKQASVTIGDNGVTAQSADGTVKLGSAVGNNAPSWVPVYPGASTEGFMSTTTAEGAQNTFTFKSRDSASKIISYFSDALKTSGFTISMTTTTDQGGMVQAADDSKKRTVSVIVGTSGDGTETAITAIEKK